MFYIHQTSCISPLPTSMYGDIKNLTEPVDKMLFAIEPLYDYIPPGVLRRMGKAVRMGVGAAMPLLNNNSIIDGIIIGTSTGGKEDCVKFLSQLIQYEEGLLTPVSFVQSTPNAIAAQISLLTKNTHYNITHSQLGLSFEFAMIDAEMHLTENPFKNYLLGAVDDISLYNYSFEEKEGCYKKEIISVKELYKTYTPGSIAGEGAAIFLVNAVQSGSIAKVIAVETIHQKDVSIVTKRLKEFINKNIPAGEKIDLLLSGENGDNRLLKYYTAGESLMEENTTIARFKHMCGEYPTASAIGLWLACDLLQKQTVPEHMISKTGKKNNYKNIIIYNTYKGAQHSFILLSA